MLYILFAVQMLINLTSCLYFNLSVLATLNIHPSFPLKSRQKWTPNWTNQTKPTWSPKMDSKLVWEVTQLTVQLQVGKVRRHYRTGLWSATNEIVSTSRFLCSVNIQWNLGPQAFDWSAVFCIQLVKPQCMWLSWQFWPEGPPVGPGMCGPVWACVWV